MRRILITPYIEGIAQSYAKHLFEGHKSKRFVMPLVGLAELERQIRNHQNLWNNNWSAYGDYVHSLIDHFTEILVLHPNKFQHYADNYFNQLSEKQLKDKKWDAGESGMTFAAKIVDVLKYDVVRSEDMMACFRQMNIRTCVYCNSQYLVQVRKDNGSELGGFQLDHFMPKDKYPFLAISFYNLQPCCANCNSWKHTAESNFNLYTDDIREIDPFTLDISYKDLALYLITHQVDYLRIRLRSNKVGLAENHNQVFYTDELYKTFVDVAEEIIWKNKIYNKAFVDQLIKRFSELFPDRVTDAKRFLYGFYTRKEDIHKRPLTKLQQDIAKEVGLID